MSLQTCPHGIPLEHADNPDLACIQCDLVAVALVESVEWDDQEVDG